MVAAVGAFACMRQPAPGWRSIEREDGRWRGRGDVWVRGFPAAGSLAIDGGPGLVFRCDLVNLGDGAARVALADFGGVEWTLAPGQELPLELEGLNGRALFEAPDDVVMVDPRVGSERDDAATVVVIVIDTLRADHVTPELMPAVSEFFAAGRRWTQATANASWTLPSVASFFSSRPVLDLTAPSGDLIGIPAGVTTWPSALDDAGFSGAAVVANYSVSTLNGFGEGFSSYQVPDGHGGAAHPDAGWVVQAARNWLDRHEGENGFLYLHFMDPHFPYRDHDDPAGAVPDLPALAAGRRPEAPGDRERLAELYAGEVRHVDRVLGRFLHELPDNALVVLTADHGESLGERGCWGHGLNLYQEAVLVPLLVRGPGVPAGTVDAPVQLLDLAPTVLAAAGVPSPPGMVGRSLLDGGSGRPIVSSTFGAGPLRWSLRRGDDKILLRMAEQPGLGEVARSKMIGGGPRDPGAFAFDLATDPEEEHPREWPARLIDPVVAAFNGSAGRMVPGLQIALSQRSGGAATRLTVPGEIAVVQAWSAKPIVVVRAGDELELSCEDAFPACVLAVSVDPAPEEVAPSGGAGLHLEGSSPPGGFTEGLSVWWNPPRPLVVDGYDETLERLRALGYIE